MKVTVTVKRKVKYSSIIEMTEDRFNELREGLDSSDYKTRRKAEETVNELVDVNDWQDDELDDIYDFMPSGEE